MARYSKCGFALFGRERNHGAKVAKVLAPTFPPPLWGRDRERGGCTSKSVKQSLRRAQRGCRIERSTGVGLMSDRGTAFTLIVPLSLSLPHKGGGNVVALAVTSPASQSRQRHLATR